MPNLTTIVVPCYNEEKRLPLGMCSHPEVLAAAAKISFRGAGQGEPQPSVNSNARGG